MVLFLSQKVSYLADLQVFSLNFLSMFLLEYLHLKWISTVHSLIYLYKKNPAFRSPSPSLDLFSQIFLSLMMLKRGNFPMLKKFSGCSRPPTENISFNFSNSFIL